MSRTTKSASIKWDTQDEIAYIRGLGMHRSPSRRSGTRLELLEGYLRGAQAKKEWADVDRNLVMMYLENAIAEERKNGTAQARGAV